MPTDLDGQEITALEYLVSSACHFIVELREVTPGQFHFQPSQDADAASTGDFEQGQQFWAACGQSTFESPFEAAVMFVNAFRIWSSRKNHSEEVLASVH